MVTRHKEINTIAELTWTQSCAWRDAWHCYCVLSLLATWNNQQVSLRSLKATICNNREALALCQSGKLRPKQDVDWTVQEPVICQGHMDVPGQLENPCCSADSWHLLGTPLSSC